ncbi:MAG: amidohydrolase family protein [Anaerolineae bacterium]|nr:amidohydrolase family protein [Anaerolineae bacterium]
MRIDVHSHVRVKDGRLDVDHCRRLIEAADRLGIEQMWCSRPIGQGMPEPEAIREGNDAVLEAMHLYPDRIQGQCFVVPGWYRESLQEIDRCLDQGMIGIKLYNQYFINDPAVFPVIEKAIEEGIPVLDHAGHLMDTATRRQQPKISDGVHFADLARRYPEAILIMGHIGGGGDYEWSLQALADAPTVYADTSGSVIDEGMIEYAVRLLGAHRLLFACDGSEEAGVGKVLGAEITEEQREAIFSGNALAILSQRRAR